MSNINSYRNAASRVLQVLSEARDLKNCPAISGWAEVLHVDVEDEHLRLAEILEKLKILREQLALAEQQVREIKGQYAEVHLRHYSQIVAILSPSLSNLNENFDKVKQTISGEILTILEIHAAECPQEGEVTEEDISKIANLIDELINETRQSDINKQLKKFLLESLFHARRGLEEFWIKGSRGLKEALQRIAGEIATEKGNFTSLKDGQPNLWGKFKEILINIDLMLSVSERAPKLIENTSIFAGYISGLVN